VGYVGLVTLSLICPYLKCRGLWAGEGGDEEDGGVGPGAVAAWRGGVGVERVKRVERVPSRSFRSVQTMLVEEVSARREKEGRRGSSEVRFESFPQRFPARVRGSITCLQKGRRTNRGSNECSSFPFSYRRRRTTKGKGRLCCCLHSAHPTFPFPPPSTY
jgi:hypothetical protein